MEAYKNSQLTPEERARDLLIEDAVAMAKDPQSGCSAALWPRFVLP